MNSIVTAWLLEAATLLLLNLLAGGALYAFALLLMPAHTLRLARTVNRQFSARRALRPLEIPRPIERVFYRHHRWFGGTLFFAVLLFFLLYLLEFPESARVARGIGGALAPIVVVGLETFFVVVNALMGVLALIVMFRPSLLKPFEALANRWVSSRRLTRRLETRHEPLDRLVERRPRLVALLILGGVTYVTLGLAVSV